MYGRMSVHEFRLHRASTCTQMLMLSGNYSMVYTRDIVYHQEMVNCFIGLRRFISLHIKIITNYVESILLPCNATKMHCVVSALSLCARCIIFRELSANKILTVYMYISSSRRVRILCGIYRGTNACQVYFARTPSQPYRLFVAS